MILLSYCLQLFNFFKLILDTSTVESPDSSIKSLSAENPVPSSGKKKKKEKYHVSPQYCQVGWQ